MEETKESDGFDIHRQMFSGTAAKAVTAAVQLFGTIAFARLLGPSRYGSYYMLLALATIAIRPLDGWAHAATKRFSEQISERTRSEILGAQFVFAGCCSVLFIASSFILSDQLTNYTGIDRAPTLFSLLFLTLGVFTMLFQTAHGRGKISVSIWSKALKDTVGVGLQLALISIGFGVAGMVYGYAVGLLIVCPFLLYFIGTRIAIPTKQTFQSLWSFARFSIPNNFLGTVYSRFDVILLGALLSSTAAGYYEVAIRISVPAIFVSSVLGSLLLPRVSSLLSQDIDPTQDIKRAVGYSSILGIPLFFGAIAVGQEVIVLIYGQEFAPAVPLLIGLTAYQVFQANCIVLTNIANGWDRPDVVTQLSAVALTINILLGIVLTLRFGAIGVVIATIIAELFRYIGFAYFTSRYLPWTVLFPREIFEQFIAGILMYTTIETLLLTYTVSDVPSLVAIICGGGSVYLSSFVLINSTLRTKFISLGGRVLYES